MKISPVAPPAGVTTDPGSPSPQSIRSLKMSTNATPDWQRPVEAQIENLPPAATKLSNSDPSSEAEAETEQNRPLSPQFAALAKERRALQQERQAFEKEKAAGAQRPAEGTEQMLARLKSEPLSVLQEAGVTYDQLAEAVLAQQDGINPKVQALEAKINALEEGVDKKFSEREESQIKQALALRERQAQDLVKDDAYEVVRETKSVPLVISLIEKTYRETGEDLDVKEALRLVEEELVESSLKLAGLKKVQEKLAPTAPPPAQPPRSQGMRTLTNRDTASVPMSAKQRALAAFYGTLKK